MRSQFSGHEFHRLSLTTDRTVAIDEVDHDGDEQNARSVKDPMAGCIMSRCLQS